MGVGKLGGPVRGGAKGERGEGASDSGCSVNGEPEEGIAAGADLSPGPFRIAELVSELLYAGKPLAEVAGYDDSQLAAVVFRPRDKYGRLVRRDESLPPGVAVDNDGMRVVTNPQPFRAMFRQVKDRQGVDSEEADRQWREFLRANPKLGVGGEE